MRRSHLAVFGFIDGTNVAFGTSTKKRGEVSNPVDSGADMAISGSGLKAS